MWLSKLGRVGCLRLTITGRVPRSRYGRRSLGTVLVTHKKAGKQASRQPGIMEIHVSTSTTRPSIDVISEEILIWCLLFRSCFFIRTLAES